MDPSQHMDGNTFLVWNGTQGNFFFLYNISFKNKRNSKRIFFFLIHSYREDGHNKGTPECTPPSPIRLKWECEPKCVAAIEKASLV